MEVEANPWTYELHEDGRECAPFAAGGVWPVGVRRIEDAAPLPRYAAGLVRKRTGVERRRDSAPGHIARHLDERQREWVKQCPQCGNVQQCLSHSAHPVLSLIHI